MDNQMNNCVIGGSYDILTLGHYHLIKKATTIFDCVYVVLAENASKKAKSMFGEKERLAMLEDMAKSIDPTGTKVKIATLTNHVYLANFAKQVGAKFLVRGIRNQIDFGYEHDIYRTNRKIQPDVETIYLMPDDTYSIVSSSWVKSLIGCSGWTEVIKDSVTPFVLNELKKWFLKEKFMELMNTATFQNFIIPKRHETLWNTICESYGKKEYHGFDHLISFIEAIYKYCPNPDPVMLYAAFLHDVDPSEEKSAEIATNYIRMLSHKIDDEDLKDRITRLIMATKHNTWEYEKEDERIIASIDLLGLASSQEKYDKNSECIFNEYLDASGKTKEEFIPLWIKGRSDFLQKMLDRNVIFSYGPIRTVDHGLLNNDEIARKNMTRELGFLKYRELEYSVKDNKDNKDNKDS